MTQRVELAEGAKIFIDIIHRKVGKCEIEFGYRPNPDCSEPKPGDRVTCYAKVTYPDGRVIEREASSHMAPKALADAFADLARSLGISVRLRYDWSDYMDSAEKDE